MWKFTRAEFSCNRDLSIVSLVLPPRWQNLKYLLIDPLQKKFGLEYSLEYVFYRLSVKNFKKAAS